MPCMELFDKQSEDFRNDIIEKNTTVYFMTAEPIKCDLLSLAQGMAKL